MSIFAGSTRGGGVIERCTVFAKDARILLICLACHYALCLEMDLISKMKYKFFCVFFQLFFSCKKDTITRGTHAKIFNFVLTPVPDSHFSRLFSSPPPPLIRKRGEKISERTLDQSWERPQCQRDLHWALANGCPPPRTK